MIPTVRGILLLLVAAPLLAASTWVSALGWIALLYLVVMAGLWALDWRLAGPVGQFEVRREHDSKLSLAADNPVFVHVANRGGRSRNFILRDEAPDEFVIHGRVLEGQAPARQAWQGMYRVHPLRRGNYTFGDVNLRWSAPLGLVLRQGKVAASEPVKVYPNLLDISRYDLLLRRNRLQELGLRHSRQFGEGTEFERLREYLPDDDFRRIDWKATARRSRPITVEYQTERSQNIMIVLDVGRTMQSPVTQSVGGAGEARSVQVAKLDCAINAVLFLAYVASGKGDKIGMMTFADDVDRFIAPHQGRGQFYRMLELLYAAEAQPVEPDYRRALTYLSTRQRKRSLIVIFTDLSSGHSMQSLASHVAALAERNLPLVVTISDPDIHAAARQRPRDSLAVYQRAAAVELLEERKVTLDGLRRQGVLTLDVPANQLSAAVINRYMELKGRMLL